MTTPLSDLPKDIRGYPLNVGDRIAHVYCTTEDGTNYTRHGIITSLDVPNTKTKGAIECTDFDTGGHFCVAPSAVRWRRGISEKQKAWQRTCQEHATITSPRRRRR